MDKLREATAATEKTWEALKKAEADARKAYTRAIAPQLDAHIEACRAYWEAHEKAQEED